MSESAQGIPGLPDLTHPTELIQFGTHLLKALLLLIFLVLALGTTIALLSFALHRNQQQHEIWIAEWAVSCFPNSV